MELFTQKGQYGQWIVTALIDGFYLSYQYYGYTKRQAIKEAKEAIKQGKFSR